MVVELPAITELGIVTITGLLVLRALVLLPVYVAVIVCGPDTRDVMNVAFPLVPRLTDPIWLVPSVKITIPVGNPPATLTVNVTLAPTGGEAVRLVEVRVRTPIEIFVPLLLLGKYAADPT